MTEVSYTARQVENVLEGFTSEMSYVPYNSTEADRVHYTEEFDWSSIDEYSMEGLSTELGLISVVDSDTGGEGHGEHIYAVVRVEDTGQLFRKTGCYLSYDGSSWDGAFVEVQAHQEMITVYKERK